jgi:hypothetical protein
MAGTSTISKRVSAAVLVAIAVASVAVTQTGVAATSVAAPTFPVLLTGVDGSPSTFVVSTNSVDCSDQKCLSLQETSDNGTHFTTLHLPPIADARGSLTGDLSELTFANSEDGYALLNNGNSFVWYKTLDGARSWERVSVGPGESILQLVPTGHVLYAVVARCAKQYTCSDYRIARSTLAAHTWTTEALPTPLSKSGFALDAYGSNSGQICRVRVLRCCSRPTMRVEASLKCRSHHWPASPAAT